MAYKLKILSDMELCLLAYSGRVQGKDFDGVWQTLEDAPDYSWEFDDIAVLGPDADYSDVESDVAFRQSIRFVDAFRKTNLRREKRCAFVCSNEMQVTMSKMFGAYVYGQHVPDIEVAAFTSMETALDWVESGARSARKIDRAEVARVIIQMGARWCLKSAVAA
ncbi:MAG: hypothetical protein WAW96_01825 [Alphaproteobacteria bacterium]